MDFLANPASAYFNNSTSFMSAKFKEKKGLKCIISFTNEVQLALQRERIWWSGICQLLKTMCVINIKEESITSFYHENGHDKMNNFIINFL